MARLRDPVTGCEWDTVQTFATIAPYTIEEAYEVADACQRGDMADLKDELGDLLLQVIFHARMAEEAGAFDFDDVAAAISDKMERRHPHIFGKRAARVGFDWPDVSGPRAKIHEELAEAEAAATPDERVAEIGDLLFAVTNYARHYQVDPEAALRAATARFEERFRIVETLAGAPLTDLDIDQLEALWRRAKDQLAGV
jgi:ATP diphosphatase